MRASVGQSSSKSIVMPSSPFVSRLTTGKDRLIERLHADLRQELASLRQLASLVVGLLDLRHARLEI